jgi:hypothetical protein
MSYEICGALSAQGGGEMAGILNFMSRNLRIALAAAIVAGCLGAAGAIGWITAPL